MDDTRSVLAKILAFLGVSALCGVVIAGLLIPFVSSGGAAMAVGTDLLDEYPAELRDAPLSQPSTIRAADGTEIARFFAENRTSVPIEEISEEMRNAIVSIEDERFYEHNGTDVQALTRAAVNNLTSDSTQGGSTLTHQYVSLLQLNADALEGRDDLVMGGTTSVADRVQEARVAVALEEEMTKDEILAGYLNIVLLGGQNYGVEAAAQYLWGIPASQLDASQAALLAGMVQSPNYYNPQTNPEAALERRNVVLETMLRNGYLNDAEYAEALATDLNLAIEPVATGCIAADYAQYFCDYAQRLILEDEAFGETREEREVLLLRGGLDIITTLDPDAQRAAEEQVLETVPVGDASGAVATLTSVEPGTGNILAMAQSTEYNPDDGSPGRTTVNYNVDLEHGESGGFPVGSTLKPFVAAAYLEEGGSMDDVIDASETDYEQNSTWEASCLPGGEFELGVTAEGGDDDVWELSNVAEDMEREMTVDYGLYHSVNTATVATAYEMDLCAITDLTERLQIRSASTGEMLSPERPSFVLGAIELSPMTLASAYATFANDGQRCEPRAISEVTDPAGTRYEVPARDCTQVLDADMAAEVNDTLINIAEDQLAGGSPSFPIAGKTGTSGEASNTWFLGSTPSVTTAAHVGRTADTQTLRGSTINGQRYEDFYGSTLAGPMWFDYMSATWAGEASADFSESAGSPFEDRRSARYGPDQATGE